MKGQRLFISHANADEAIVNRIVTYLEAQGAPCWIAGRDIPPRAIYAEAITQGIQECSACAVIVSAAANASAAVKRELELASHHGKPFIPIRVDATEPGPGLDYYLRNTQWIHYSRDGDRALDRIAAQMASGAPAPRPPPYAALRPPLRKSVPTALVAAIAAITLTATGSWFVWTQLRNGTETQIAETQTEPNSVASATSPTAEKVVAASPSANAEKK